MIASTLTTKPSSAQTSLRLIALCLAIACSRQSACGQVAIPAVKLQARVVVAGANAPVNERDHTARKWVRGLIQQELNAIQTVCKLND
jgi:hypothetical protein